MSLAHYLAEIPASRPLWRIAGEMTWHAADLRQWSMSVHHQVADLRGRRVAIYSERDLELGFMLLLLDGVCSQLTILPADGKFETLEDMIRESKSEVVVSGSPYQLTPGLNARWTDLATQRSARTGRSEDVDTLWLLPTS